MTFPAILLAAAGYSFGMISDSHWTGPEYYADGKGARKSVAEYRAEWLKSERANLERAARDCMAEPAAEFFVHTGDLVDGRCGSLERQVAQLTDGWQLTRGAFPSEVPFIAANGNHETYDFEAPGTYAYPAYERTVQKFVAKELGLESVERHFSFRHGPDLFVVYNSNVDEFAFFEKTLAENPDARYVFAIGHIPAINPCEGGIEIDSPEAGNRMDDHNRFLRLLQSRNVILLCGDTHRLGLVDYVTGEGRLTELMGASVDYNGAYRELARSTGDFPINWESAYQPGGVISERQRFLKGGLVRFWGATGAGFWKLHVSDESVRADLYTWDREGVVKSVVLRGADVDCAPVKIEVAAPLTNGLNRLRVSAPTLANVRWRAGLPAGWTAKPFDPESGILEVTLPNQARRQREEVAIRLYATDMETGRVVANEDRHFLQQDDFWMFYETGSGDLEFPPSFSRHPVVYIGTPYVNWLAQVPPDFADEDALWKKSGLLELFFDVKNLKKPHIDGDTVQLVVMERVHDAFDRPRGDGKVRYRALVIRDGGKTRKWVDLKGGDNGPYIPWSVIAPTDDPGYRPSGGDDDSSVVIGMDAAFDGAPLMGGKKKIHDDPSTWGRVRLAGPDKVY